MKQVTLTEAEFDEIIERLDKIEMEDDGYIPSEEEIFDYIEEHPDKYYLYLLWFSEHKPEPKTKEEKERLKKISKITNQTIKIV